MTIVVGLLLAGAVLAPAVIKGRGAGWGWLVGGLAAAVVAVAWYTWSYHLRSFLAEPKGLFQLHPVDDSRAGELQREAEQAWRTEANKSGGLTASEAMIFAMAVVKPAQFRRRIVEEYTPERRTLRKFVTIDLDIPRKFFENGDVSRAYIPVVINKKGELLDDFHIYEANNDETQWLSYRQYLSFAAKVLHVLLLAAEGRKLGEDLSSPAQRAERSALHGLVKRLDTRSNSSVDLLSGAREIENLAVKRPKTRDMAGLFVRQLTSNYPIVAVIDGVEKAAPRHRFKYQLTLTPDAKHTPATVKRRLTVRSFVEAIFGARPVTLTLDIANSQTCESYHLHVHAPDDLYLASQEPVGFENIRNRPADLAPTLPHLRFRRRLGQPHAHFYARYVPKFETDENARIVFKFFEVPPGSVLRATITAIAAFCILWVVGLISSFYPDPGTDAPAFLLAFPALAATWLGFESPSRKLLEGTLSARFSLVVSAVLSIAGTALFMLHKSSGAAKQIAEQAKRSSEPAGQIGPVIDWPEIFGDNSILGIKDLWWGIVIALAIVNVMRISYLCIIRTWEYSYLFSKAVE